MTRDIDDDDDDHGCMDGWMSGRRVACQFNDNG